MSMRGVITCRTSVSPNEMTLRMISFSSSSMAPDWALASSRARSSSSVIIGAAKVAVSPNGRTSRLESRSATPASGANRTMKKRRGRAISRATWSGRRRATDRGTISPTTMVISAANAVRTTVMARTG